MVFGRSLLFRRLAVRQGAVFIAFFATLSVAVMSCLALAAAGTEPEKNAPSESWFLDSFAGPQLNEQLWYVSDGWTNGDHQDCHWSRKAVATAGGSLSLARLPGENADSPPLCGEIQTRDFIRYGTVEARIKTPAVSGMNAALFTYAGPSHNSPHDEIDIEILTRDPAAMTFNTFINGQMSNGGSVAVQPPFDAGYHTVAFQWMPDRVIWYLNGAEIHRTAPGTPVPSHAQKIYLSFWSTTKLTDWMGKMPVNPGSQTFYVDWVAYTPPGMTCLFPASVTCH